MYFKTIQMYFKKGESYFNFSMIPSLVVPLKVGKTMKQNLDARTGPCIGHII